MAADADCIYLAATDCPIWLQTRSYPAIFVSIPGFLRPIWPWPIIK